MKNRSRVLLRLLATACAATAALLALPVPALAEDLPAPTVRRSTGRAPARTVTPQRRSTRTTSRVVHASGTPDYGTPYVRPAAPAPSQAPQAAAPTVRTERRTRTTDGTYRFRRAPAPVASPGHVASTRKAGRATTQRATAATPKAARPANAPSEPVAWQRGKRHSTYVPPSGPARRSSPQVPSRPKRTVLAQGRSTYVPPSRPARSSVSNPTVRRTSPSYADLARTQPQHVAARQAHDRSRAEPTPVKRRSHERRNTSTRRTLGRNGRSTSVPAAVGEQVQPQPSTRRQLPLRPRPGCCADG